MKSYYMRARIISAIGAVTLPVLVNAPLTFIISGHSLDIAKVAVTVIGFAVALLVTLEGVLHHREQWQNYRTTEQVLQASAIYS